MKKREYLNPYPERTPKLNEAIELWHKKQHEESMKIVASFININKDVEDKLVEKLIQMEIDDFRQFARHPNIEGLNFIINHYNNRIMQGINDFQ